MVSWDIYYVRIVYRKDGPTLDPTILPVQQERIVSVWDPSQL